MNRNRGVRKKIKMFQVCWLTYQNSKHVCLCRLE
jgi:hypothetical protein